MKDFRKSGRFGQNGNRQNFNHKHPGDRGFNKPMFPATCDSCHKQCEVPFRPSGDKPVYCNDCFREKREDSSRNSFHDFHKKDAAAPMGNPQPNKDRRIDDLKRQLDGMSVKLDRLLSLMEKQNPLPKAIQPLKKIEPAQIAVAAKKPSPAAKKVVKKPVAKKKPAKKKK